MKRVLIVGGGFAGLSAAKTLSSHRETVDVTLVDRLENMQFKPLLPDIVSGKIPTRYMIHPIQDRRHSDGFHFMRGEANEINLSEGVVRVGKDRVPYDFLILATGSETNFFGNDPFKEKALKLDDSFDGERISHALTRGGYERYVVCGGGYTGIEIASHIRKFLQKNGIDKQVCIVEMLDTILAPLPKWMKDYSHRNLEGMGIDLILGTKVTGVEDREITLSDGTTFSDALLVWSAGMKASEVVERLDAPKEAQRRVAVDATLRFEENAYAVGNTGCFKHEDACPRMASQMAVRQGEHAARNVIRSIRNQELSAFKPVDFGYFVPMANGRSCGKFMGLNVRGWAATFLHYVISAYRTRDMANKWGVLRYGLTR